MLSMIRVWPLAVLCLIPAAALAVVQDSKPADKELAKKIQGSWNYESGQRAGAPAADENLQSKVTIDGSEFRLGGTEGGDFVMEYKLNTKTSPAEIDFEITEGPVPEGTAIGIIKFEGGKIHLCYDPTGQKRPDTFSSTEENGWHLFVLKGGTAFDPAGLRGQWKYKSGRRAGEEVDTARLDAAVEIKGETIVLPAGPDSEFVMKYTLTDGSNPVAIDMEIESGPVSEGEAQGIIKLEQDELTLCYDPTGAKRPEAFESTAENGFFLFVLTRQGESKGTPADDEKDDGKDK